MSKRIWILGAADPEMELVEKTLRECGETVVYATASGVRVHPGNAYKADCPDALTGGMGEVYDAVYRVECAWDSSYESLNCIVTTIDHHRPGDPGYGRPPSEFMSASSIGQVYLELARLGRMGAVPADAKSCFGSVDYKGLTDAASYWRCIVTHGGRYAHSAYIVPRDVVLAAAADHCLGAAYRGECPSIDPDALMRWRVASRARFQGRSEADVLADVEAARQALRKVPGIALTPDAVHCGRCNCGCGPRSYGSGDPDSSTRCGTGDCYCDCDECRAPTSVSARDMRRDTPVPELVEAAARDGVSYVSGPLSQLDGRHKYTVSGTADVVRAWMQFWAPSHGLIDVYGDPARGFAGGYAP